MEGAKFIGRERELGIHKRGRNIHISRGKPHDDNVKRPK